MMLMIILSGDCPCFASCGEAKQKDSDTEGHSNPSLFLPTKQNPCSIMNTDLHSLFFLNITTEYLHRKKIRVYKPTVKSTRAIIFKHMVWMEVSSKTRKNQHGLRQNGDLLTSFKMTQLLTIEYKKDHT